MNTPKIAGFVAQQNIIVFIYRQTRHVSYLMQLRYVKTKDKFTLGSRFYGRFYPSRCDISPDGRNFLYFAWGKSQKRYKEYFSCWTAICSPPKITAQFFSGQNDTWNGGGFFIDDRRVFISSSEPIVQKQYSNYQIITDNAKALAAYKNTSNWQLLENIKQNYDKTWIKTNNRIWLYKYYEYDNSYNTGEYDMYNYVAKDSNKELETPLINCTWADFDNFGRLLVSRGSEIICYKNYRDVAGDKGKVICDFEDLLDGAQKLKN